MITAEEARKLTLTTLTEEEAIYLMEELTILIKKACDKGSRGLNYVYKDYRHGSYIIENIPKYGFECKESAIIDKCVEIRW